MKSIVMAGGLLMASASTSLAMEACQYSGKAYSVGASIRLGEVLVTCAAQDSGTFSWFVVAEEGRTVSANCLYGAGEYSHGAIIQVDQVSLICGNGRWYKEKG